MKINTKTSIKFIVSISLILNLVQCKNKDQVVLNENTILFSDFQVRDSILFQEVFEYKEGVPKKICIADSTLVIFNYGSNAKFYLYNYSLKNRKLSEGYLRKGRGPKEAIGAFNFGIFGNSLWVHDVTMKKIMTIDKTKILTNSNLLSFNEYPVNVFYHKIDFIDSLRFLGVGCRESPNKISEVGLVTGEVTNNFGSFSKIPECIPLDACKDAYLSYIYSKPSGGKLVLPYEYTDVIEIYDEKEHTCASIQGPYCFHLDFTVGKGSYGNFFMDKTKKTKKAFLGGTVTDKYIYLVYSGLLHKDNWNQGKYIYIYDWDGNPVKELVLDRYISMIAVSKDDKTIYSYDRNTGFILQASIN